MRNIVHRFLKLLLLIGASRVRSLSIPSPSPEQLYVVPFPTLIDNNSDGSLSYPYSSLQQALDHIDRKYHNDMNSAHETTINLYPTHHFINTIHFK
jgi:hypothetical protein